MNGDEYPDVPAPGLVEEEEAPASECCVAGCDSLGTETELPELLSVCHITSNDDEPIYTTGNNGRPLCLKDILGMVEYRVLADDPAPICTRSKRESFSNEVEGEVDIKECCGVVLNENEYVTE